MLLIEHYIAPSVVHGLGVYTSVFIRGGSKVWEFNPVIDKEIAENELPNLPPHTTEMIKRHGEYIPDRRVFRLSGDGDNFMNHSDEPNLDGHGAEMFALRDIQPGEELFIDYRAIKLASVDFDFESSRTTMSLDGS